MVVSAVGSKFDSESDFLNGHRRREKQSPGWMIAIPGDEDTG
jgi:hypothetical protein